MKTFYMTDVLLNSVDALIEAGKLDDNKIVLFGVNSPAFLCKQYLQERGYEVFAYVDNSEFKVNEFNSPDTKPTTHHMFENRRINAYLPSNLPEEYKGQYVFLLYSKYEKEMLGQLDEMGYKEGECAFLPGGFWNTEGNKRLEIPAEAGIELTDDEIKSYQLDILKYVHEKCEKLNLRYCLHYGTLLGAIRHKGYIPWDDDIDISMPYRDLMILLDSIKKENGRYGVFFGKYDGPHRHFFAKIEDRETIWHQWDFPIEAVGGLNIDVFPLSGMPNDEAERNGFYKRVMDAAWEYHSLVVEYPNASEKIEKRRGELKQFILTELENYSFDDSEYVFTVPSSKGHPLIFPKKYWRERVIIPFENDEFYAPAEYDEFLTSFYGDYMTPPPIERRVSNHRFTVHHVKD